jgi:hypothetical protein
MKYTNFNYKYLRYTAYTESYHLWKRAHNPKLVGSNPAPATKQVEGFEGDFVFEAFLLF